MEWQLFSGLFLITISILIIIGCTAIAADIGTEYLERIKYRLRTMATSRLSKSVEKLNRSTPIMIHPSIRLDSITMGANLRITYNYTLPTYSIKNIQSSSVFVKSMQPSVIMDACGKKDMRERFLEMLGLHVTYIFVFSTVDKHHISTFEINRAE